MYYRLKQSYVLRGWEGLAWVLVKRPCNQIYQLSQEEFQVLILCDGETELSNNLLDITLEKICGGVYVKDGLKFVKNHIL